MSDIPAELRYGQDHLWARRDPGSSLVRIGVTDFAQESLGDVVDVTLPDPGDTVRAGQACGDIESVKSLSDLIAPVTGTVRSHNGALSRTPELVNTDPYGQGWLADVEADPATLDQQLASLLDPDGYRDLVGA
jgi:glycine cleavage system H protein